MSFFRRKETNVDNKARLEHKLYLARVSPEPDFDLSDCNLKAVPSGVFALCNVFRKEKLFLQQNQLTGLSGGGKIEDLHFLKLLDLHSNALQKLPSEIVGLTNLRELDVSANKLTHLPENIGELLNLRVLKVSDNNLRELPQSIGNLRFLLHLNVKQNKKLTKLPASLCHSHSLKEILLDKENFEYPPRNIVEEGTAAVMQFLSSELGVKYVPDVIVSPEDTREINSDQSGTEDDTFQAKILQLETLKARKQQELLHLEKNIIEQQRKEFELQSAMKNNKEKLLEDLAIQQSLLEREISKVHQEREAERVLLVNEIQQVETAANNLISQLLISCNLKDSLLIQALVEQEREEEQRLLSSCHEDYHSLKHTEVLSAMENLFEEEARHRAKIWEYEHGRSESARAILNQEEESAKALSKLLQCRDQERESLVTQLQHDGELQRAAVATLLERSDSRSWGLTQHVKLVQEQLAALTSLEMKRRQLEMSEQMDDLCRSRAALSELLVDLLEQQAGRRKQLLETMHELDRKLNEKEQQQSQNFWLVQYQRLLDLRSTDLLDLERSLDPLLAQHLLQEGVVHCLPLLSTWVLNTSSLESLNNENLISVGITSSKTREQILKAVHSFLQEKERTSLKLTEQATTSEKCAPSSSDVERISSFGVGECVICMDDECLIIFIPCGHLCCCMKCSESVEDCPLCRTSINQKIRVLIP